MKRIIAGCMAFMLMITLAISAHAHGGRTDSSGGHKDNENVSGLGYYHYHCGGYPPHLHNNGVCPYQSSSASSSQPTSKEETAEQNATQKAALERASKSFWAQSGHSDSYVKDTYIEVVGIELSPPEKTTLKVGETLRLKCQVLPSNATDQGTTWKVSDRKVASIAADGTLTAKAPGKATVTIISNEGYRDTVTITVEKTKKLPQIIEYAAMLMLAALMIFGYLWLILIKPLIDFFR